MKTNKSPEKIYLQEPTKVRTEKKYDNDVEYIRTNVFIEKAISWLKEQDEMIGVSFQEDFLERFQNYMKGE